MKDRPMKLMIPGPIQPDPAVLDAMGSPVVPHYGASWRDYYNETVALLKQIFNTQGDVFIMVGAGTTAIESCIGSALSTGEKIIIGINGFFGARMKTIAEYYGLQIVTVRSEWGKPLRSEDYTEAFRQHPDAVVATAVHLETSTSVVNPVEEIGPIVCRHGAYFIVDAVSSLGGMDYYMDEWEIDMCASSVKNV